MSVSDKITLKIFAILKRKLREELSYFFGQPQKILISPGKVVSLNYAFSKIVKLFLLLKYFL